MSRLALVLGVVLLALSTPATLAFAWRDTDQNRIDDDIDRVHANGWNAAFVDNDPSGKMIIGVENPDAIVYAIYIGYDHAPTAADQATLATTGVSMVWPFQFIPYIESRATWDQIQLITALAGVTRVEAIPVMYATNHYGSRVVRARDSRGITKVENYALFPSARQELGLDGTGIVIGILDTGVNDEQSSVWPGFPGHESLIGKFLGGGEFWCGQPACVTPSNQSLNPQHNAHAGLGYHGTHVAASAMGTGGLGGFFAGVAPAARLVDCKVLGDAGASVGGAARGLEWCIANRNTLWASLLPGSIWQGIDVINMSLGGPQCTLGDPSPGTDGTALLVNAAVDAGIVVAIATGNDDVVDCIASPASADKSIAVGATLHAKTLVRTDDRVTLFSNEGPRHDDGDGDARDEMKPNVVTPGEGIFSAEGDPQTTDGTAYSSASGTSMASPHTAGCAALVLQANPALTPLEVRTILENTAEHNILSAKATGDRGQDPFGVDPNYDPSCGWGLVDVYAAAKEALNSASGVQVVKISALARPQDGAVDVRWISQREYPFLGYHVNRAPDVNGAPGAFVRINTLIVPPDPSGDPIIAGDDNRTPYLYVDSDPALTLGTRYWYQIEWVDLLSASHLEPPVPVEYGALPRVATAFYQIIHNAVDNDLQVRLGSDLDYDPGNIGEADFEVRGPLEAFQDSARVILPPTVPANTGTSTVGTIEHFWSVGFTQVDDIGAYLPPSTMRPWFLHVTDGGFVNRTGRVSGFSMFVNDAPGSPSGTTYVTDHSPMPQPTGEFGLAPALLWIPEPQPTATVVATFRADADAEGCRLTLIVVRDGGGSRASVFRSTSEDFATREAITEAPVAFTGDRLEYLDRTVEPGITYHYWVQLHEADGSSVWSGPVSATFAGSASVTFAASSRPNPVTSRAEFAYAIGADVAGSGPVAVSMRLHDLQGRLVRTLREGPQGIGQYRVEWDGRDDAGRAVGAGVYYLKFRAGSMQQTGKVSVVK